MALKDQVKPSFFKRLAWPFQNCLHKAGTELKRRSSFELKKRVSKAYSQIYQGVKRQRNGYWCVKIYANNEPMWLGTFKLEEDAAIACDRASIMLKCTSDSGRNIIKDLNATRLEEKFQSHYNRETILEIIQDGSYQSRFNDYYLRKNNDKENDNDLPVRLLIPKRTLSQRYRSVVHQLQNGLWVAQIYTTNNQCIWLGTFDYKEDVAIACDRALIKLTTSDSPRNILKFSKTTHLEAKFQSLSNRDFAGWLLLEKELAPSDVGKLNRLVIPEEYAVKFLPLIAGNHKATLTFYDFHNKVWKFRYCYWKSCQSYVFTRGWNQFVKEKGLMAKDDIACYFDEDIGVGRICYRPNPERGLVVSDEVIQTSDLETKSLVREHKYLDQETSHEVIQTSHVETKSLVRVHKYLDQETSLEVIQEPSHEVIQTSNEETKEFRLFGVQIAY